MEGQDPCPGPFPVDSGVCSGDQLPSPHPGPGDSRGGRQASCPTGLGEGGGRVAPRALQREDPIIKPTLSPRHSSASAGSLGVRNAKASWGSREDPARLGVPRRGELARSVVCELRAHRLLFADRWWSRPIPSLLWVLVCGADVRPSLSSC